MDSIELSIEYLRSHRFCWCNGCKFAFFHLTFHCLQVKSKLNTLILCLCSLDKPTLELPCIITSGFKRPEHYHTFQSLFLRLTIQTTPANVNLDSSSANGGSSHSGSAYCGGLPVTLALLICQPNNVTWHAATSFVMASSSKCLKILYNRS